MRPLIVILSLAACTRGDGDSREPPDSEVQVDTDSDRPDTDLPDTDRPDTDPPAFEWSTGDPRTHPPLADLLPLPGGPAGVAVFTSNNPETFDSTGFLYEAARTDPQRGGDSHPFDSEFGVYFHHANDSGSARYVQLLVTNPSESQEIYLRGSGTAWTNTEKPLARGSGADYAVAEAMLDGTARTTVQTSIPPVHGVAAWSARLEDGAYVDGRFTLTPGGPAYVYLVVTDTNDANAAVTLSQTAAGGNIHPPGDPPPPYGREAGVYANDTWSGSIELQVPEAGRYVGYAVNTATGTGHPQIQAFPALTHFDDSSTESVGQYGNTYDLTIVLTPGPEAASRVKLWLSAYGGGEPNFWFNGPIGVDASTLPVWLAPDQIDQQIADVALGADPVTIHLRIPVPGLSSIPLALFVTTE